MVLPPLIYLLDSGGNAWLVGLVDYTGPGGGFLIETTLTISPLAPPIIGVILQDASTNGRYWKVGISTSGQLLPVPYSSGTTNRTQIVCQSPSGKFGAIQIIRGQQETVPTTCLSSQIGSLYIPGGPGGFWTQPDGPGTTVFPKQRSDPWKEYPVQGQFFIEQSGLWAAGCGHFIDLPAIYKDFDPCTQTSAAVVACPMCSYVQYIISPYELALSADPQFGTAVVII